MQILAINKQSVPHQVHIMLNGASAAGHRLHIYTLAPTAGSVVDIDALYDGVKMPSVQQPLPGPKDGGIVPGSSITYTVPAYTAVVLDLNGTSPGSTLSTHQISSLLSAAAARTTSFPPLVVATEGRVSSAVRNAGQTETLSATVKTNYDIGMALVDLEVSDSAGKKVFQQTQNVTLRAGIPATVSYPYTLVAWAGSGKYTFTIGVFGLNRSPTYTWNNSAGSFTVRGPSQPLTVTAHGSVSNTTVQAGQTETLSATVQANYDLGTVVLDLEVYDGGGKKVFQQTQNVSLHGGTPITISQPYALAASVARGTYTYKIGVFGQNWTPTYTWNNSAGSFTVG